MLAKLMKYEFKATKRFMLLIFSLLIVLSFLLAIQIRFNFDTGLMGNILMFMLAFCFFLMNGIVLSAMFFFAIMRFKNNLLGAEGYLMHTLPVKTSRHILSKTFVSTLWTIFSCIAVGVAYVILFLVGVADKTFFGAMMETLFNNAELAKLLAEPQTWLLLMECILCAIVTLIKYYLQIYASMAVGYSFNNYRPVISIGIFVLIEIITTILETVAMNDLVFDSSALSAGSLTSVHIFLWIIILYTAVSGLVFYFITQHFLSRKLNLL